MLMCRKNEICFIKNKIHIWFTHFNDLSIKCLRKWSSLRNEKISEVFWNDFVIRKCSSFKNSGSMILLCFMPLIFSLKSICFDDKKMLLFFVMIRGKSPPLPKWGSGLVIEKRSHPEERPLSFRKEEPPIISKRRSPSFRRDKP